MLRARGVEKRLDDWSIQMYAMANQAAEGLELDSKQVAWASVYEEAADLHYGSGVKDDEIDWGGLVKKYYKVGNA